jgi:ribosome-binding protein aMBF1 (putative translation factor)
VRGDWVESARVVGQEHPHDTEDLVRLVTITRHERGMTEEQLAAAAGVSADDVRRFEAAQIVPAEPLAMRFIEAMKPPPA